MKTAERQHIRMQELMGVKPKLIKEQPDRQVGTSVAVDSSTENLAQGYVGASNIQGKVDQAMGSTAIDQGYVNHVVLELLQGTGRKFGFTYSFVNDVKLPNLLIKKKTKYTSDDAQYLGTTSDGNTIVVPAPESEESKDKKEVETNDYNRNKKIVELFKLMGIEFNTSDSFIEYFRKGPRQILRRLKKEFPEYRITFLDRPSTEAEEELVVSETFFSTKSFLIEGYKESIKQLRDLEVGKQSYQKDPKMLKVLEGQLKKEKKELLRIIKPKFNKVYLSSANNLTDDNMINHALYMDSFLDKMEEDYPQYKIKHGGLDLTEETKSIEVGRIGTQKNGDKEEVITPKTLTINLRKEQLEIYLHRTYPCTVSVDGENAGENEIKIIDIESEFTFTKEYSGTSSGRGSGEKNKDKKEGEYDYVFPRDGVSTDKGKEFAVNMTINNDPLTVFTDGDTAHTYLRQHNQTAKYTVTMLDNGFQLVDLDASVFGRVQKYPQENEDRIRFLFGKSEGITYDKTYSPTVLSGNEALSSFGQKLDVTIYNIKSKTAGY